jgi:hypothetical protein
MNDYCEITELDDFFQQSIVPIDIYFCLDITSSRLSALVCRKCFIGALNRRSVSE